MILRSGLLAADAPSKTITMGFIGMGTQNRGLLDGFLNREGTRVLAVCDVDTKRRENAKKMVEGKYADKMAAGTYKGCDTYSDFRELVARKDIDAVCIATPDHWHALTSIACLNSGKDVYCEKPLAHTVLEGRAMVNATRKNNRVLQTGSMQRSMFEFRAACELVRNGAIGKISHIDVNIGGPAKPCDLPTEAEEPGLNWDLWLGPAPMRGYSSVLSPRGVHSHFPDWRNYQEYAIGMIGDWGAHHFDIAQWGLGFDDGGPVEFTPAPGNAGNGARFKYANGVEVIHTNKWSGGEVNGVLFHGDKGRIQVNRGHFKYWEGETLKVEDRKECAQLLKDLLPANAVHLYKSEDQLNDFLKCVRDRSKPICDVEIGHRTASVCNLVSATYYYRKPIKWDPKTESFVDGTGDAKWLTREYRGEWKLA